MSRRRKNVVKGFYTLRFVCRCGSVLGKVIYQPTAPERFRYLVSRPLEFRDVPKPSKDTGKVVGRCPGCQAEPQRRWEHVREVLHGMATRGDRDDTLTA